MIPSRYPCGHVRASRQSHHRTRCAHRHTASKAREIERKDGGGGDAPMEKRKEKRLISGTDRKRKVTVVLPRNVDLTARLTSNRLPVFVPVVSESGFDQPIFPTFLVFRTVRYTGTANTRTHASELPPFVHSQMPPCVCDPHRR